LTSRGARRPGLRRSSLKTIDTSVEVAGLCLKNPVLTASGTCGYGLELSAFLDLSRLGGLVVKGLSVRPRRGNPPPRIVETCGGMLNAIGLENIGMEAFIRDCLPELRKVDTILVVNVLGESEEEYGTLVERLGQEQGVSALELNVSCPNVKKGGIAFGSDPAMLEGLVRFLRRRTEKPLIVKLSPNVTDIAELAARAEGAGADALSLINTLRGMSVDAETRRPALATVVGGLSGPAIKPIALRMVWEVARRVRIPVIGIGGILTATDAVEFLICGASAVQVGTAHFRDPASCLKIAEGIEAYLRGHGMGKVSDLVGALEGVEGVVNSGDGE
jgi:dihydroorotate dehydrogenase (NAD+) catalytic subunit